MGWFDEQIKQRKISDDADFSEAFYQISDSVTGAHIAKALNRSREKAVGVLGDIIRCYGCTPPEVSADYENINDEIEWMCRPCGIMHRPVQLEKNWALNAFGAYLAKDSRTDEIVALIPDKRTGNYYYFDSNLGKKVKVTKKLSPYFEGEAICFYKPLPLRTLKAKDIFKYGMSLWSIRDIILPMVLLAITTLLGLLLPKLNYFIFNEIVESENVKFLISTVIFIVCLTVSRMLIDTIHTLISAKNSTKTSLSVEAAIMMRVLSLPADFFKQYHSGEITQRVKYANSICNILIEAFFDTGILSVLSLVYISQMVRYGGAMAIAGIIVILLTVVLSLIITAVDIKYTKKFMENQSKENGVAYSMISGVQKIKLAGAEKRAFAIWGRHYANVSRVVYDPPLILKLKDTIPIAISLIGIVLTYFIGVKSGISVADYYAYDTAYAMVFGAFSMLLSLADSASSIKPTLEMIQPILDTEPEVSSGKTPVAKLNGNIELNNITFSYSESMPAVLNNLSLKIKAGQYIAIVGKTGCGKSTLMRILLGFEKPDRGAVYYDGRDLATIDVKSLRRNIGTVMQNGKLFQGDIYSNITVSAPHLTLDDAWEAAEMAGMADDIRRMPMGMHTLISEGGGGISGGQRQRLMIARAVAPKPNILIFDEATSALDNITQKAVSDSLDTLNCTRIVIAHRLSTIRHCDRIIFLDGGKIVEDGTYEELIAQKGLFAELVERQRLDEEK